jgi:hypothetical protein
VFFPGYGWIAFEPSGYRPQIQRSEVATTAISPGLQECYEYGYSTFGDCGDVGDASALVGPLSDPQDELAPVGDFADVTWTALTTVAEGVGWIVSWGAAALAVAVLIWRYGGDYLARRRPPREAVLHTWWQFTIVASVSGLRQSPAQTPTEYARGIAIALEDAWTRPAGAFGEWLRGLVRAPESDPATISNAYDRIRYGGAIPSDSERESVDAAWRELRWRLPVVRLLRGW